ncbi:hypothetical protein ACFFWC_04995 [Plantactinospora siamensis]|uniref:Delta-60 repeat protein n=1 Tax=Plantactinospora siamensis TaxID=555372 RepID=A0ABV6NRQ2_9ACTN
MTVAPDGGILLLGPTLLSRFTPDGRPDEAFGVAGAIPIDFAADGVSAARGLAVQPDGRILVTGYTRVGDQYDVAVARYLGDGTPDPDFGVGGLVSADFGGDSDQGQAVLVQPDGRIVVAGNAWMGSEPPGNDLAAARYAPDGTPDPGFGTGGKVSIDVAGRTDLAAAGLLQPDGRVVVIGRVADGGGDDPDLGLVRWTVDGRPDPTFGTAGVVRTNFGRPGWWQPAAAALQPDGRIVVVGRGDTAGAYAVTRLDPDGTPDLSFGVGGVVTTPLGAGDATARAVLVQPDGRIVVAGYANADPISTATVLRYLPDGTVDPDFARGGRAELAFFGAGGQVACLAAGPDGTLLVAGSAINVNAGVLALARLLP